MGKVGKDTKAITMMAAYSGSIHRIHELYPHVSKRRIKKMVRRVYSPTGRTINAQSIYRALVASAMLQHKAIMRQVHDELVMVGKAAITVSGYNPQLVLMDEFFDVSDADVAEQVNK